MCTWVNRMTSCHHVPWVQMDGRTLIAKAPLDRTGGAMNIYLKFTSGMDYSAHHVSLPWWIWLYNLQVEKTIAWRHWQQSLSNGPSVRVSDGLPCFRGIISGWSNSVRRLSARVTGFRESILYAVTAINDNGEKTASVFRNSRWRQPPCLIPVIGHFSISSMCCYCVSQHSNQIWWKLVQKWVIGISFSKFKMAAAAMLKSGN